MLIDYYSRIGQCWKFISHETSDLETSALETSATETSDMEISLMECSDGDTTM